MNGNMKKQKLIVISIIIALIMLIPIPNRLKDGGSVEYRALIYKVTKLYRFNEVSAATHEEGWIIEILGFEIYNNSHTVPTVVVA